MSSYDLLQIRVYDVNMGFEATEYNKDLYGIGDTPEEAAMNYFELLHDLSEDDNDTE